VVASSEKGISTKEKQKQKITKKRKPKKREFIAKGPNKSKSKQPRKATKWTMASIDMITSFNCLLSDSGFIHTRD
jgi:hypothetical protein